MRPLFLVTIALIAGGISDQAIGQTADQIVHWSVDLKPQMVAAGGQTTASITATIVNGWHVYSVTQPSGGPKAASVRIPDGQEFKAAGNVTGSKPKTAFDQNFNMNTEFYEKSASIQLPVSVAQQASTGAKKVKVDVRFQTCSDRLCLPPTTAHLEAPVTVKR